MVNDWVELIRKQYGDQGCELFKTGIPEDVSFLLILFGFLGVIVFLVLDRKSFARNIILLFLLEYFFFLICTTIVFREETPEKGYNLVPFWSYRAVCDGQKYLILENILNILVFVPVGMFCGFISKGKKTYIIILGGLLLSMSIELIQFILKRGFAEVDDVIHNTIGCVLGLALSIFLIKIYFTVERLFRPKCVM
jgi:glycopeptide antibiotics resistance protein